MSDEFDPFDVENLRLPEAEAALRADIESRKRNGSMPPELGAKLAAHRARGGKRERVSRDDLFIQIPVRAIVAASKLLRDKRWLVVLSIHDRVGKDERNTIELGNEILKEWGVDPETKIRTLRVLEQSGDYAVEWRQKNCPLITVREDLTMLPIRRRHRGG
jgi:hypothetical protein